MKRIFVRLGLVIIRALVALKPRVLAFFGRIGTPFVFVARFLVTAYVPIHRLQYRLRRNFSSTFGPAKNRLMVLLTHRSMIHIAIASIAAVAVILNIQTDDVRAETFGEKSALYVLIASEGLEIIEEYAIDGEQLDIAAVQYQERQSLVSFARSADNPLGAIESPFFSGGTLAVPAMQETSASVAPRTGALAYFVQEGDTLSTVAEQFDISLNTLLWANDLTVRSVLALGAELVILPVSGVEHTVKSGDTLLSIAGKYDVEAEEIQRYNALASLDDLRIGENLLVPGGTITAIVPARPTNVARIFTPTPSTPAPGTSDLEPVVAATGAMIWPTDLSVITQYYGWRHTGIDIDCGFNNDNYAAADGVVQFSGWKGGYGNTIEINHGNGLVTLYGHHASLYVSAGQQISKGTPVGRCGTTGRSTGTHIHFEVKLNGRFQNPLEYIR